MVIKMVNPKNILWVERDKIDNNSICVLDSYKNEIKDSGLTSVLDTINGIRMPVVQSKYAGIVLKTTGSPLSAAELIVTGGRLLKEGGYHRQAGNSLFQQIDYGYFNQSETALFSQSGNDNDIIQEGNNNDIVQIGDNNSLSQNFGGKIVQNDNCEILQDENCTLAQDGNSELEQHTESSISQNRGIISQSHSSFRQSGSSDFYQLNGSIIDQQDNSRIEQSNGSIYRQKGGLVRLGGGMIFLMQPRPHLWSSPNEYPLVEKEDGSPFAALYDDSQIVLADNFYLKGSGDGYIRVSDYGCANISQHGQVRISDNGYIGIHNGANILHTNNSRHLMHGDSLVHREGSSKQFMFGTSEILMKTGTSIEMATIFDEDHYNAMRNTSGKAFLGLIGPAKVTAVQKVGSTGPGGDASAIEEESGLFFQDKKLATQEWAENLLTAGINGINPATIGAATKDWVLTAFSVFNISTLGIPHGVSNSASDNIAKTVSMPGLLLNMNVPDGLIIGVRFANGHNAVQESVTLNINAGGSVGYIGGKTLWNEKGRIGTVGNIEVLQDSTRFQIFRWDASVNRFIWLMAVSP